MTFNITSANAILTLQVIGLIPVTQIQEFAVDDAFTNEVVENAESQLGVDDTLAVGWIPTLTSTSVHLKASSPSIAFFDTLIKAEDQTKSKYQMAGVLKLPSVTKTYTLSRGFLFNFPRFAPVQKVLGAQVYGLRWHRVIAKSA